MSFLDLSRSGFIPSAVKTAQIVLILAAGLALAPARPAQSIKLVLFTGMSLPLGLFLALSVNAVQPITALLLSLAIIAGFAGALVPDQARRVMPFTALIIGVALGAASRPIMEDWPYAAIVVFANWFATLLSLGALAYIASHFRSGAGENWMGIVPRVASAWIAAIAVLAAALHLSGSAL